MKWRCRRQRVHRFYLRCYKKDFGEKWSRTRTAPIGEDLTSPTRGTGAPKVPGRWFPPLLCLPSKPSTCNRGPTSYSPLLPPFPPLHGVLGGPTAALADQPRPSPSATLYPRPSMQIDGRVAQR